MSLEKQCINWNYSNAVLTIPIDTRSQPSAKTFYCKRSWICNGLVKKKGTPTTCNMVVSIPSSITKTRSDNANLQLSVIPYKKETTPWPDRHPYLGARLTIPKKYVYALTMKKTCKLMIEVSVTDDNATLVDGATPLQLTLDVPDGQSECVEEWPLLSHPTVLDASTKYFYFQVNAWFELTPKEPIDLEQEEVDGDTLDITLKKEAAE